MQIVLGDNFTIAGKPVQGQMELNTTGIHLVLGDNGVGKTSFFRYLLDHQPEFNLAGRASFISQYPLAPVSGMKVHQIFTQLHSVFPERVHGKIQHFPLLEKFQAAHLLTREVSHLSGGENQILKLLVGFYLKADYYFLDEPFQFLDARKFQLVFEYITRECTAALIIIDHRNPELLQHCAVRYQLVEQEEKISLRRVSGI